MSCLLIANVTLSRGMYISTGMLEVHELRIYGVPDTRFRSDNTHVSGQLEWAWASFRIHGMHGRITFRGRIIELQEFIHSC